MKIALTKECSAQSQYRCGAVCFLQLVSKFTCHFKKGYFKRGCFSLLNLVFIQIFMNNKVIVFVKINLDVISFIDRDRYRFMYSYIWMRGGRGGKEKQPRFYNICSLRILSFSVQQNLSTGDSSFNCCCFYWLMYISYPWRIFLKDQLCSEMLYINKIKFLI